MAADGSFVLQIDVNGSITRAKQKRLRYTGTPAGQPQGFSRPEQGCRRAFLSLGKPLHSELAGLTGRL